jgi:hypothetical protein
MGRVKSLIAFVGLIAGNSAFPSMAAAGSCPSTFSYHVISSGTYWTRWMTNGTFHYYTTTGVTLVCYYTGTINECGSQGGQPSCITPYSGSAYIDASTF